MRQHDVTDCGAACLASVAAHHGLRLPLSRIRQYASTDRKGTNVLGMVEAATRLGFVAKGVKGPFESLAKIPLPAIAHVVVKGVLAHFVVVYEVRRGHVLVMDPADGKVRAVANEAFRREWSGVLVLLVPGAEFAPGNRAEPPARRFWSLVRPHRTVMSQALVGAALYTLLGLSTAIYVQKLVDHVLVDGNRNLLNLLGVAMLALLLAQLAIGVLKDLFTLRTGQKIDAALILGYYRHLLELPQTFFDTMRTGEIISRVNDAVKIRAFINDVSLELIVNVLVVLFSFGLMFVYSWMLALLMAAIVPLYAGIFWITNRLNRVTQRRLMESAAELEAHFVESIGAASTIKRFALERVAGQKTESRFVRLLRSVYRSGTTAIFAGNASQFVSRSGTVVLLWIGAGLVIDRVITPGELMSFYALAGYMTGPMIGLIGMNRTVQDALIAADRLFEIMDLERDEAEGKVELTAADVGDIRFHDVSFRYGTRTQVFEGFDLHVRRGLLTALVGESGSGKSTIAALLQKVYPVGGGKITIGEYDLRYVSTASLRRVIATVPQEIHLFAGDVVENIAPGDPEPDMERLLEICGRLGITAFVESLPAAFRTPLGENGVTLSGGQRQRIALARALYRDPQILILDEATASLDAASEAHVQRAIERLRDEGKSVLMITHRLGSVVSADRIVVLADGHVVESGSHAELMVARGSYWRLWSGQLPPEAAPFDRTETRAAPSEAITVR